MTAATSRRRSAAPRRGLRGRLVVAVTAGLLVVVAGPAYSYWSASSTGAYARARAATLTPPVFSAGSVTATSAALAWTRPFTPTAYALGQSTGTLTGCPAAPATASTGCTATSLTPNTSYTWTLASSFHAWVSPATVAATTSKQATTTTLSAITPSTGSSGTSFSATATVSGDAGYGTPAGSVVLALYTGATCTGTPSYTTPAQALSGGAATAALQPAAGTYYWQATYSPTDSYNLASTSSCSAAITVTSVATSSINFTFYYFNGAAYNVQGRPTALVGGLSLLNAGGSTLRTLTSLTVTVTFPDSRVSGAAPTGVSGTGWAYQSVAHVGSQWVYTFGWTGSLAPYIATSNLGFTVALGNNGAGTISSTATASNPFTNTPTFTATTTI